MGYMAYDGTGNQWWVPTEGDPGYVSPAAPVTIPVDQGLSSYDSFNLGADNWIRGSDGNYYKQTGPTYNMEGILQSAMGMDPTPYTAQQLQAMGATQRTINPEYNVDDGTMTGLMGAGLLFGGLGAFGGMLGGAGAGGMSTADALAVTGLDLGTAGAGTALTPAQIAALGNVSIDGIVGGNLGTGMLGTAGAGSALTPAQISALGNVSIDGIVGGNLGTGMLGTAGAGSINPSLAGSFAEMIGGTAPAMGTAGSATIGEAVQAVQAAVASGAYTAPQGEAIIQALGASGSVSTPLSMLPMQALTGVTKAIKSATGFDVTPAQLLSGVGGIAGGLLSGRANSEAANTYANAQTEASRIAAEAARFKPVGVTTRFGQSKFTKDAQGNVVQAGYDVAPDVAAMRESLMGAAPGMLSQFTGSQAATAPMGTAAQRAMSLGQGYLNTDPLAQAQKYYNDQQAIMATQRARDEAGMLTGEFNRGTYGLATGATGQMGAANPRLEAMYNAQRQQDLGLAAAATQGGMDYAKFGAGMVGTGGDLLKQMYGTQSAAYSPFQTAMGGATMLEGLGQNALDMSVNIGKTASPAQAGSLLAQGMLGAAQTQNAASYSPWGTALMSGANAIQGWQNQAAQQQQQAQQQQMLAAALAGRQPQAQAAPAAGSFFAPQQNSMPQEWQWGGIWS